MVKKIIGFDIDGVLTDYGTFLVDEGSKRLDKRVVNPKGAEIHDVFGESEATERKFWEFYLEDYFGTCPPRRYTAEVLSKLSEKYEIHIITNRGVEGGFSQDDVESITKKWLKKNKIPYDLLIFNSGSKLDRCIGGCVNVMVEDNADHIKEISKHIPTICFDANYNKKCKGKNIHRCFSMYDLYKICNEIL